MHSASCVSRAKKLVLAGLRSLFCSSLAQDRIGSQTVVTERGKESQDLLARYNSCLHFCAVEFQVTKTSKLANGLMDHNTILAFISDLLDSDLLRVFLFLFFEVISHKPKGHRRVACIFSPTSEKERPAHIQLGPAN